jgi:hypothetical protein
MRSAAEERAKLAETRRMIRDLTVIGLRDNLTTEQRAAVKDWELALRTAAKLRQKAVDHAERWEEQGQ